MKSKTLSDFEWQIMRIVWAKHKISVREVYEVTLKRQERAYTTVQTYMERLAKKGLLKKEKIGLVNFYSPVVQEKDLLQNETFGFIKKTFNGSFAKMAAFLFDVDDISEKDLQKLKSLIKEKESGNG